MTTGSEGTLRALIDLRDRTLQKSRIAFSNRASAIERGADVADAATTELVSRWMQRFSDLEEEADGDIRNLVKDMPIVQEMTKVKGVGEMLAAKVVSMVHIHRADTVSALWRYCFPAGEMVATENGQKPIETINLSDKVFGQDGKLHDVTALSKRHYEGDLITIQASKMLALRCTPEHRVLTAQINGRPGQRKASLSIWKEAREIKPGDWLVIPKIAEKESPSLGESLAYFFGRFVGDGSTAFYRENRNGHGIERAFSRITFGLKEKNVARQLLPIAQTFGEAKLYYVKDAVHLQFGRTSVARDLRMKFGHAAHSKHIPAEIFNLARAGAIQFMRGYFDSDGCYVQRKPDSKSAHVYVANTRSKSLALQIQLLSARLGGLTSIHFQPTAGPKMIKGRTVQVKDRYQISLAGGDAPSILDYPNEGNRKASFYVEGDTFLAVRVKFTTQSHFNGWVYDLTSDGSFLVNNVVVHNCGYGVKDGERERPTKGEKLHYNWRLKSTLYLVASSFLKVSDSPYRVIYDRARDKYENAVHDRDCVVCKVKAGQPLRPGHQHARAMRAMIKVWLQHLWVVWRSLEGLPVNAPYAIGVLGHAHYYRPDEFGWATQAEPKDESRPQNQSAATLEEEPRTSERAKGRKTPKSVKRSKTDEKPSLPERPIGWEATISMKQVKVRKTPKSVKRARGGKQPKGLQRAKGSKKPIPPKRATKHK